MKAKSIRKIDAYEKAIKNAAIYCRVSSGKARQLNSLTAQISALTRMVYYIPSCRLKDIYVDIASGKNATGRKEYQRMLRDCRRGEIDVIYVKSVSRFGRDTVDVLSACNEIRPLGVRILFQEEGIDSDNLEASLMLSIATSLAQAENESRSDNINMGIQFGAISGTSKLYSKKCFGYDHDKDGNLIIKEPEASAVRLIFESYLVGYSILGLRKLLLEKGIDSPTNKILWCKQSIEMILNNFKYTGDSIILDPEKTQSGRDGYCIHGHHPAVISREMFEAVQIERVSRSNVIQTETVKTRKSTKYSSKRKVYQMDS